ncbi:hypothetical protein NKH18_38880 [Streptomyces sp. M10(2022)]
MTPFRHRRGRPRPYTVLFAAIIATVLTVPATAFAVPPQQPGRGHSALAPTHLRVDGIDGAGSRDTDALVGRARPALSWTVNDSARAQTQTGYRIRVEPARTGRGGERTPGWDSGRVASPNSTDVAYAGPARSRPHLHLVGTDLEQAG